MFQRHHLNGFCGYNEQCHASGIVLDGCWSYNEQFMLQKHHLDGFCGYNEQFHASDRHRFGRLLEL